MVDPTSNLEEDVDPEDAATCAVCGASLADAPDRRTVTWIEEATVGIAHFCDEDCRAAWDDPR
jgi:hypothetical protein